MHACALKYAMLAHPARANGVLTHIDTIRAHARTCAHYKADRTASGAIPATDPKGREQDRYFKPLGRSAAPYMRVERFVKAERV